MPTAGARELGRNVAQVVPGPVLVFGPPRFPSRPMCAANGPDRPGSAQLPRAPAYAARPEQLRQGPPKRLSGDCHDHQFAARSQNANLYYLAGQGTDCTGTHIA